MGEFFSNLLGAVKNLARLFWLKITLLYAVTLALANWIFQMTEYAIAYMETIDPDMFIFQFDQVAVYLDLANHFFPVVEVWALITTTIPYILAVLVFRFLKQFIPTMSN